MLHKGTKMKSLTLSILMLSFFTVQGQHLKLKDLRKGKFKMETPLGDYFFYRTDSIQIEEVMVDNGTKARYSIAWPDDSTYILQQIDFIRNPENRPINKDLKIIVRITELKKKSYLAKVSSNLYPQVLDVEIFLLKKE